MRRTNPPIRTDSRLQGGLYESPAFVLMQAGRLALEMAARALDLYELTVTEFAALQLVRSFGGICQSAIAERLGISRAAMSGIAMTLDRRGLIDRRQDMFDPGRRAIYLTPRGQELLADASQALAPVDSHFRGCLRGGLPCACPAPAAQPDAHRAGAGLCYTGVTEFRLAGQ